jgi:hypothetical protein
MSSEITSYKDNGIPNRVKCFVPLKVDTSNIEGRGIFALKAIKAGKIVFSVTNPLITVVNGLFHYSPLKLEICHFWHLEH